MVFGFYILACEVILLFVFSRRKPLWNATPSLGSFSHFRCTLVMVSQHHWQALKIDASPPSPKLHKTVCDITLLKEKAKEAKWLHFRAYEIITRVSYSFPHCTTYFCTWRSSSQLIPRKKSWYVNSVYPTSQNSWVRKSHALVYLGSSEHVIVWLSHLIYIILLEKYLQTYFCFS